MRFTLAVLAALALLLSSHSQARTDAELARLLRNAASQPALAPILKAPERFELQILWTRVLATANGPRTRSFAFRLDRQRWFAAASLVKLPLAIMALEQLGQRGLPLTGTRLQADWPADCTPMPASGGLQPESAEPLTRTLARMLVISDNEASNRLYQWLGPPHSQQWLSRSGYADARLTKPLMVCSEQALDTLGAWTLQDASGRTLATGPARSTGPRPRFPHGRVLKGRFWLEQGVQQPGPHDFSDSNFLPLELVQQLLMAVVRPELLPQRQRLALRESDRRWLQQILRTLPSELREPPVDANQFPDYSGKYLLIGDGGNLPAGLRIYNKVGQSYGYLSDVAYIEDTQAGFGFFLSAVIFVDVDGTLNDGRYAYERLGLPFMAALGRLILAEERRLRQP